jgi:hypothetical protein
MFNNLGIRGVAGITTLPYIFRRAPLMRRPILTRRPVACGAASIGGSGNDIINIGGLIGPPGPPGPAGPPGTPGLVPVVEVTTSPFEAALTDYYLAVDVGEPTSIVLPVSPTGTVFVIKDIDGDAATNPITITTATTIDGATSALINANYGSITLIFNGTEWNIV